MKYQDFEASVCRESDMHGWRFFVDFLIKGEWYPVLYDATPDELSLCLQGHRFMKPRHVKETVEAYFRARELNAAEQIAA